MNRLFEQFNRRVARETHRREHERHIKDKADKEKKNREAREDRAEHALFIMETLVNQIASLEATLEDRYGDNFAENLAAEYLDENTYKKLMSIEDQDERRHAIAITIGEGIANGTIDPSEIYADPVMKQWLEAHTEKERLITSELNSQSQNQGLENTSMQDETKALNATFMVRSRHRVSANSSLR